MTTRQVAEHLGLAIDEKGMTCCPFHGGSFPNMRVSDRYYWFDCRASGDVIDFVAAYLSVDKLEAAELIANDFGVPIEDQSRSKSSSSSTKDKTPPTPEQRHEWRIQKTQRQFEKWRTRSIDLLNSYYAILDEQERACIRRRSEASERNALDRITEKKAVIQFYLNTLQSGTLDDQIDLYLYGREVITRIERRLENISKEKMDKLSAEMVPVDYVREQLHRNEKGKVTQTIENCMLAVQEDSFLRGLVRLNLLSCRMVICKEVPWRRSGAALTDNDMDNILSYMAQNYDLRNDSLCRRAVSMAANNDSFHPIRDYLNGLKWDGQQRLRHALRHFLGAPEDELTYLCLKTYMMGALQRVFWPGCKCEYVLTLIGGQGVGKSTFFRFLAIKDDWFTDDLVDFKSSRIYEKINGHWIIEMPEMLAMMNGKRAEETKAFVSRQSDVYRDPYAVYPADRPRQCVFGATTNRQKCLPFDHTGNRRFLPVTVDLDNAEVHILEDEQASREYINQMWAEAMDIFKRRDYTMTFPAEITRQLDQLRQEFMPEDTNAGLIQAYLDEYEGDYVCTTQLYREALRNFGEPTRIESSEIGEIMRYSIQGWKVGPQHRFPIYGQQRSWIRDEDCKQERKRDHPNSEKQLSILEQGFVPVTDTSDVPFPEAHEPS